MDVEISDGYEQEECVDPSIGMDEFERDSNDPGEDIAEAGNMDTRRIHKFDRGNYMEPFVGMEFQSCIDAGKFYSSYARNVGFETKIRQSRSNRAVGKWYVQFSCNKEGFRRAKVNNTVANKADTSDRPAIRCGCLATMKVKLVDHNRWRVIKVNLSHNHVMDASKEPPRRSQNFIKNSSAYGQDECVDPSSNTEEIEEDCDDMEEESSELNTVEMERASDYDQSSFTEPTVGMEFESYVAAGNFYNSYARHVGFDTKIRQSRSNMRHGKRYVQFSCNREGFKRAKTERTTGIRRDRPDARCGCLATMKIKLTGQNKWKVFHVNLVHNHEVSPRVSQMKKSSKQLKNGARRRSSTSVSGPETQNPPQTFVIEAETPSQFTCHQGNSVNFFDRCRHLDLGDGDLEAMHIFFERMQLRSSSFFYSLDLNDEGNVRSAFWVDSRSRAAYEYFGDVVTFETSYLANNYKIKLALFIGVNHHGQSVLLGCGLLSSDSKESFMWLLRTWLLAMSDHFPYAFISDQMESIQEAVSEVFPHSHYRLCLWQIMKHIAAEFGCFVQYNEIKKAIKNAVCDSLRIHEFERDWNEMIGKYNLQDNQWLKTLYKLREKWVPCFVKYGFWAGICSGRNEPLHLFFDDCVHPDTCLREFFEHYEVALNAKYAEEAFLDFSNFKYHPLLDRAHWFEAQLVNIYTLDIFKKFQQEVSGMVRCYDMSPVHIGETITTYVLKERPMDGDGRLLLPKEYEVFYNKSELEVTCICNLFLSEGFLCRHSLYILQNHGVVEIPSRYILARWRKDYKHSRSLWYSSTNITANATTQWQDILHHKCRRILEEGSMSERGYLAALKVLDEGLEKVILENDAAMRSSVEHTDSDMNGDTLENTINGSTSIFYSNLQERVFEPNTNRLAHDLERTANNQKVNSYLGPHTHESCLSGNTSVKPATNALRKRHNISSSIPSASNCYQLSENLVTQTQDLLGCNLNQHGFLPATSYFYGASAFPGYIHPRLQSPSVTSDNGFVPFTQVPVQLQQARRH